MPYGLICDRELAQVVANHFRLDFNTVEHLAVVDTNDTPDHFRNDDHISEVCLDGRGLLVRWSFLLGLSQFLDEPHRFSLQASLKSSPRTRMYKLNEVLVGHVEELFKLNTSI